MHFRRVAAFLLGAWLAGSLVILAVCVSNLSSIGDVRESRDTDVQLELADGHGGADKLLKYIVAVENTRLLSGWELAQIPLGLAVLATLVFRKPTPTLVALPVAMLALAAFEHLLLMPEIAWLGQVAAVGRDAAARGRLANIVKIYGVVEAVKFLLGIGMAILLFMMHTKGRQIRSRAGDELLERRVAV